MTCRMTRLILLASLSIGACGGGSQANAGAASESEGPPLEGTAGAWTYVEFPDTQCRDGSPAGVAVNFGTAKKLMIYLEGGGWCLDAASCAGNPASADVDVSALGTTAGTAGVFDRANPDNPVRDWNFVYLPYCTGDLYGGANPDANVPGVGPQKLVGYLNTKRFLARIAPTFSDVTDVLLTGSSAGGTGTFPTSLLLQRAFPKVKVRIVDDSGAPASKAIAAACLLERQHDLFKTDDTYLAECGDDCPDIHNARQDFAVFVAKTFRDRPSGLVETTEDAVVRAFLGSGNDDCTGAIDAANPGISAEAFRTDLLDFRARVQAFPNFGTFYPTGDLHTWLSGDGFYDCMAGGVRLRDWFAKIADGESPGHAGP
jgi:hypothetical protein